MFCYKAWVFGLELHFPCNFQENLTLAIGLPGKMGAAGVVLWGSTTYFHTHDECQLLQKYINTVLGPYVKNLTQFLSRCCVFYCSAHGRCVDKELEAVAQHERRESGQQHCLVREELLQRENRDGDGELDFGGSLDPPHPYDNYVCRCLPGWTGDHCEKKLWAWGESCMCLCYFSFADHNYEEILGALEPKPKSTLTPHEWFL